MPPCSLASTNSGRSRREAGVDDGRLREDGLVHGRVADHELRAVARVTPPARRPEDDALDRLENLIHTKDDRADLATVRDYIQRLRSRVYVLENTLPENYMETLEAAEAEVRQLREERDALQGRVYALENAFPEDVRDEMEKGRYAVQRAKIAEAEAQRLREGLREIEQAASIYAASKHPEKDAEDLFLDVGVKARALLADSQPDGGGA